RVSGVLAHRPKLLAVHLTMDPARERIFARLAEPLGQPPGEVVLAVELLDLDPGVREPARIVGTDDRRDGAVLVGGRHTRQVTRGTSRIDAMAPGSPDDVEALLAEQIAYYCARAPEYSRTALPELSVGELGEARA